jgi:AcrR family transcriptional regulator
MGGYRGVSRRRGAALEDALLQAASEELAAAGYANLTMEGVAARARTSKMVLYRRWHNRAELVLAVMRKRVVTVARDVPDTGELRGDVLALLRRLSQRYAEFGPDIIHGLMAELHDLPAEAFQAPTEAMHTIMTRAAERGEVRMDGIPRRILSLPVDLARHELLVTHAPVPEAVLAEIVDDVFLPLVRCRAIAGPER